MPLATNIRRYLELQKCITLMYTHTQAISWSTGWIPAWSRHRPSENSKHERMLRLVRTTIRTMRREKREKQERPNDPKISINPSSVPISEWISNHSKNDPVPKLTVKISKSWNSYHIVTCEWWWNRLRKIHGLTSDDWCDGKQFVSPPFLISVSRTFPDDKWKRLIYLLIYVLGITWSDKI